MKVKLIKKIKKNAPVEKDGDWNESKKHHAGHAGFDFAVCAYEDLQDDLDKEQKSRGLGLARNLIPRKTRGQWRVGKRVLWPVVRSFRSSNPQALHFWSVSVKRLFCRSRDCRPVHCMALLEMYMDDNPDSYIVCDIVAHNGAMCHCLRIERDCKNERD